MSSVFDCETTDNLYSTYRKFSCTHTIGYWLNFVVAALPIPVLFVNVHDCWRLCCVYCVTHHFTLTFCGNVVFAESKGFVSLYINCDDMVSMHAASVVNVV